MPADPASTRPSLSSRAEAERFLSAFGDTIARLAGVLADETAHLAAGRIRQGLAVEADKTRLAGDYLRGLECVRANAVALARFAPDRLAALRGAHDSFRVAVERNQAVIATARAVSEGLVKGVAEEMARRSRPSGYGPPSRGPAKAATSPIVFSGRI